MNESLSNVQLRCEHSVLPSKCICFPSIRCSSHSHSRLEEKNKRIQLRFGIQTQIRLHVDLCFWFAIAWMFLLQTMLKRSDRKQMVENALKKRNVDNDFIRNETYFENKIIQEKFRIRCRFIAWKLSALQDRQISIFTLAFRL